MDRILLVDDDREVLHVNGEFLKGKGYQVATADCANEALRLTKEFMPHCIVLDVMMPGMDGFEALERLRKITQVPVLFLTGRTEEADRIRDRHYDSPGKGRKRNKESYGNKRSKFK